MAPDPAFECGHAFFENRNGRIGDARIDMPGPLQIEEARRMIHIGKHIGCRLVDRCRPRTGHRIGVLARMQTQGREFQMFRINHVPVPYPIGHQSRVRGG